MRCNVVLPRGCQLGGFNGFALEATNKLSVNAIAIQGRQCLIAIPDPKIRGLTNTIGFEPTAGVAYRVLGFYYYRGGVEQTLYSWGDQHCHFLDRLFPAPRKGTATSDWFAVKPEASHTNPE